MQKEEDNPSSKTTISSANNFSRISLLFCVCMCTQHKKNDIHGMQSISNDVNGCILQFNNVIYHLRKLLLLLPSRIHSTTA